MNESKIWVRDLPKILKKFYRKSSTPFPINPDHSLIDLVEWLLRIPSSNPRIIIKSFELKNKILSPFEINNLSEIEKIISRGGNIKPYLGDLTRSIRNRQSKKNDFFSSDWGLLHLHLGADFTNKKIKVSRSKRVLIARFENDRVYFIDVVNHGRNYSEVWGQISHLEILHRNWPFILGPGELKGIRGGNIVSASEYIKLRNSGITCPILIDDKIFIAPGNGIALDGSQTEAVRIALQIYRELDRAELEFRKQVPTEKSYFVLKNDFSVGFLVPKKNKFHIAYRLNDNCSVTNFFFRMLSEISLCTDKSYHEFVTPIRIRN